MITKTICLVNLNAYCLFNQKSEAPMGGAELDMYTLAQGLKKKYNVTFITGDWGQNPEETVHEIRLIRSVNLKGNYLSGLLKFIIALIKADSEIYISSGAGPEAGLICLYSRLFGRKYIYRSVSSFDCDNSYIKGHRLLGLIYLFAVNNCNKFVTTVKNQKKLLSISHPGVIPRVTHINQGLKIFKRKNNKKAGVLWVSRCVPSKHPELFIDLAKRYKNLKFTMICPKQGGLDSFYEDVKSQAMLVPNLKFINYVPFKQIQKFYDRSYIFINTSDFEGFTYTLIQCGQAGTPVVYYRVNPDGVITKHDLGYFSNGNYRLMCSQISTLSRKNTLWRNKSEAISKYFLKFHDIDSLIPKWTKIFNSL
ncbi:MAG: Group 1 glycosyl transferase [Candidatus Amesbacteria bacterium GW2011_GWB1_47_19]|nr:MAG: Group 1 glycosyl transferase [Candidatus Amesbacteria bacterium GW2011_GWA1_44_24]KKU31721.1 MAG: Group 1 glycosyl transferase [Candidatus Amesbacteria bacterium GW2011_GWC1_46_24]KKU67634.1 MAG: Group 1 glycosyl transferase [Candidatus Amesbacteria bacterium GW2011_GWB1_47_19]OGD06484.1 MAG: hypothetical protein A2379_02480 [Candidatus Amesbacteria bacterium RIFOXYB1_FULL_47_13]HBC72887.1 hypothetical protein [Candidatus Amesbacteria bacterium]